MADPIIDALDPTTAWVGDTIHLRVLGKNFTEAAKIQSNGAEIAETAFVSEFEVTTAVAALAPPGQKSVTVIDGGIVSNAINFELRADENPEPEPEPEPPAHDGSPNTDAIPAEYMSPVPPDVYRQT